MCLTEGLNTGVWGSRRDLWGWPTRECCERPVQSSREQNISGPIKEVEQKPAKEKKNPLQKVRAGWCYGSYKKRVLRRI